MPAYSVVILSRTLKVVFRVSDDVIQLPVRYELEDTEHMERWSSWHGTAAYAVGRPVVAFTFHRGCIREYSCGKRRRLVDDENRHWLSLPGHGSQYSSNRFMLWP